MTDKIQRLTSLEDLDLLAEGDLVNVECKTYFGVAKFKGERLGGLFVFEKVKEADFPKEFYLGREDAMVRNNKLVQRLYR